MHKFYQVATLSDSPAIPDALWLDSVRCRAYCQEGHLKQAFWRAVIRVEDRGADLPYNFVQRLSLNYIRDDLLAALSPQAQRCLRFGRLADSAGNMIECVRTIRRGREAVIRGGKKSYCWRCRGCRRVQYYPIGEWYLLRDQVPDRPIFPVQNLGLIIIAEPLRRALCGRRWKRLAIDELPVLDEPLDGFPANLNKIRPEQERPC